MSGYAWYQRLPCAKLGFGLVAVLAAIAGWAFAVALAGGPA